MRFLGIDLGTASLKLAIVDEDGQERASASVAYAVDTPHRGWAQTPVEHWWNALVEACARLPAHEREAVGAIGFAGQMHGVVVTDDANHALLPAMLWPDTRASDLLDAWPSPQPNPVAPGMAGPLLRWLAFNQTEVVNATRWALQPKDWLRTALGGQVCTDPSDACATALAAPSGVWDDALIARLGLDRAWFAPLAPSYAAAGSLSASAAQALGLRASTVLAVGASDTACAALGSGLCRDGEALLTTGSGGQIVVVSGDAPASIEGLHAYRAATDQWYQMAAIQNVGVALETARKWLVYDNWAAAYADAFNAPAPQGVSFLPYLSGERSPWMNPSARGGWLGLSLGDTRGAMMRAAFEGVAFALRAGLDAIRANASGDRGGGSHATANSSGSAATAIRSLRLAGGGSIDPRWRQLLADALDADLDAVDCPNAAARGAAILGGMAIGHWHAADLVKLAPSATRVAIPAGDKALSLRYKRFIDLYQRNATWF